MKISDFGFGFGYVQFSDLCITRNHDGWENVKYRIKQVENENIAFDCFAVEAELIGKGELT